MDHPVPRARGQGSTFLNRKTVKKFEMTQLCVFLVFFEVKPS